MDHFARARARGDARAQDPSALVEARYDAAQDAASLRFRGGESMTIPSGIVPGLEDASAPALGSAGRSMIDQGLLEASA